MNSKYFNDNYLYVGDYRASKFFDGLYTDLELLRSTFVSENDMSYKAFAKTWRDLKFSSIFGAQSSLMQMLEFSEGVLHSAKGYIFSQCLDSSVFGMYLIQSLYYKQCLRNLVCKIRLTLKEFIEIQKVLKNYEAAGYIEPIWIFRKLYNKNAIQFVVMPIETGIEIGFRKYHGSIQASEVPVTAPPLQSPIESSLVKQFDETLQAYLKNKKNTFHDSELFSSTSNFVADIQAKLNNFGERDMTCNVVEIEDEVPAASDIGTARRKIKDQAFASGPIPSTSKTIFNLVDELNPT